MLLTVITICFNDIKGLRRTLKSVNRQVGVEELIEHIVIDGDSKDGTREYLASLNYNYVSEADKGIYDAFNKGINRSNGQYITFLNAGDEFSDNSAIKNYLSSIKRYGQDIIWFQNKHVTSDMRVLRKTVVSQEAMKYLKIMPPHQSCVYKKEIFSDNLYDIGFKIAGDYDWFIRNMDTFKRGRYVPIVTIDQFYGGVSNSGFGSIIKSNKEAYKTLINNQKIPLFWLAIKLIYKIVIRCRSQIFFY